MSGVLAVIATGSGVRVTVSPSSASGEAFGGGTFERATSNLMSMIVVPSAGSYSYSWVYVSGETMIVNSPALPNTTFSFDLLEGTVASGFYKARVTSGGQTYDSEPFLVQLSRGV